MTIISGKELITYQEKLFYIYRIVKTEDINHEDVLDLKHFWLCDTVIKGKYQGTIDSFLFLKEISDVIMDED